MSYITELMELTGALMDYIHDSFDGFDYEVQLKRRAGETKNDYRKRIGITINSLRAVEEFSDTILCFKLAPWTYAVESNKKKAWFNLRAKIENIARNCMHISIWFDRHFDEGKAEGELTEGVRNFLVHYEKANLEYAEVKKLYAPTSQQSPSP